MAKMQTITGKNSHANFLMESITNKELITAYIKARYPWQFNTRNVVVIDLYNMDTESELDHLTQALEEAAVPASGDFLHPGILIIEMPAELAIQLCNKFDKAGFDILVYENGKIIHENR